MNRYEAAPTVPGLHRVPTIASTLVPATSTFLREVAPYAVRFLKERRALQREDAAWAVETVCAWLDARGGWEISDTAPVGDIFWEHFRGRTVPPGHDPSVMVDAAVRFLTLLTRESRLPLFTGERLSQQALHDGLAYLAVVNGLLPLQDVRPDLAAHGPQEANRAPARPGPSPAASERTV